MTEVCEHIWAIQDEIGSPYCAACGEPWSVEFHKSRKGDPTERAQNSTSYGSHAHAYEVAARKLREATA